MDKDELDSLLIVIDAFVEDKYSTHCSDAIRFTELKQEHIDKFIEKKTDDE